ncbi:hypothetical protein OVA07_08825 [Novosphingobium sp. SL115]|uniref:hypothetical protein n=1 Tax=Novosphingobium sp. SL115 TaxID=2995150 RepID=UPI002273BC91|nr:hypothetical protein [Novosphingobium sp. SL115]MCY1671114.1 hypothetical protein [Novosphingobium sp. SL115]
MMNEQLDKQQSEMYRARQRGRNRVLGAILLSLAVLFFAISIVKIAAQSGGTH